jgi:hypothetical protein
MGRTARTEMKIPQGLKKLLPRRGSKVPAITAEILPLQAKLRPILKRAWPDGSEKDISWLTADLAGLWEVSRVHIALVRKLLRMTNKPNKRKFQEISQALDSNWFSNAPGHLETMATELARFKASLYRPGRGKRTVRRG